MTPSTKMAQQPPRLAIQAFWLTFSKIIAALLNIFVPIILVRVMTLTEVGEYKQVFLFAGTAVSMSALGVGTSAFYFLPRRPDKGGEIVFNVVFYNLLVGAIPLIVLLVYPQVLRDLFNVPEMQVYGIALGVLIVVQGVAGFLYQIPSALQDVKSSTVIILGSQLTRAVLFTLVAILSPNVHSLLTAAIAHQTAQSALLVWYLHKKFGRFWTRFDGRFFIEQLKYAVPVGLLGVLGVLRRDMHNYFVTAAFSPARFAIYSTGCLQTPFVPVIIESVTTVMVVRVSELQHQARHREVVELTARTINRLASILFPIVALLFVTRRDLIVLMYTRSFEESANIYGINLLLLVLAVFTLDPIIQAYIEVRKSMMAIQVGVLAVMAVFLYFAMGQLGMIGAILVAVAANAAERIGVALAAAKTLGATLQDFALLKDLGKVTIASIAVIIPASFVRDFMNPNLLLIRLAVTSTCVALLYAAAVRLFHLPGDEFLNKESLAGNLRAIKAKLRR